MLGMDRECTRLGETVSDPVSSDACLTLVPMG